MAFIIDVPDINFIKNNTRLILHTSFNTICKILILLQDIEILNKKNGEKRAGLEKPEYIQAVKSCGYIPPTQFQEKRINMVCGKAIMGRHTGHPLDWGYYEDNNLLEIIIDVTDFWPNLHVIGKNGIHKFSNGRDLLACYRHHLRFNDKCMYWDLMPKHIHMPLLFSAIKSVNQTDAENFVIRELGWKKIGF